MLAASPVFSIAQSAGRLGINAGVPSRMPSCGGSVDRTLGEGTATDIIIFDSCEHDANRLGASLYGTG